MNDGPMFVRVFQYTATPGKNVEFEQAYGDEGKWVQLFATAEGYLGSTLERAEGGRYRTQDMWGSGADFKAFMAANQAAYDDVNRACGPLQLEEELCGHFTEPQPAGDEWDPV